MSTALLIDRVRDGAIEPGRFGHREHLLAAWEVLRDRPFLPAAARYGDAIATFAARADAADKYSVTITLALLSLVAERMAIAEASSFEEFLAANADLAGTPLSAWYSKQRLDDTLARRVFLMPDRAPATGD